MLSRSNSHLGKTLTDDEEVKNVIDLAEKNIDGRVDFEEFKYIFKSQLNTHGQQIQKTEYSLGYSEYSADCI